MSDDKMEGHVSALQLLLGDWDPYTVRRAINLAFPDTFTIEMQVTKHDPIGLETHLADTMRALKVLAKT